ncbi:MAG: hypothetical protein AB1938_23720 [Myxococcota bacterium]
MQLKPHVDVPFQRGPALAPPDALVSWLNQQGRRLVRLPVIILVEQPGRVRNARLGDVAIALDDSALGISLADHVRRSCPGAPTCHVWLEGLWDPSTPETPTLQLRRFVRAVSAGEAADFVEVEAQ